MNSSDHLARPAGETGVQRRNRLAQAVLMAAAALTVAAPVRIFGADGGTRTPRRVLRGSPAAPVLEPPPGTYDDTVAVTLSCSSAGAAIHYTTDGSEPTAASPVYDGHPVEVSNHVAGADDPDPTDAYAPLATISATIRAVAIRPGGAASAVAGGGYAIDRVDCAFDVPYDAPPAAGGTKHLLDVYAPRGAVGAPVVLFIHGGGWTTGDKNIYLELGNVLAGHYGLVTVIANYELSAAPWYAVHPDHVEDAAAAFSWVYHNIAAHGGDPNLVFLLGQSAGGHLVALLGADPTYLQAVGLDIALVRGVVAMSGVYDLGDLVAWPGSPVGLTALEALAYRTLFTLVFGDWQESTLAGASPAVFARTSMPPLRVIYAWDDLPGFAQEAVDFHGRVSALGQPFVDLVKLEESDIPPEVLALGLGGHVEEIVAINTRDFASASTRAVVEFVAAH